jgi:putative ATP-dependent endonuclease of the OLD family
MHLSRLFIKNFRSIRLLDLQFSKGRNVIVGRNNAGKSNIIKALDLVLGESSPTYAKSVNITENDFYSCKQVVDGKEVACFENEILSGVNWKET